jgi:hypothetical protein
LILRNYLNQIKLETCRLMCQLQVQQPLASKVFLHPLYGASFLRERSLCTSHKVDHDSCMSLQPHTNRDEQLKNAAAIYLQSQPDRNTT